jgi:hypothetical protein
MGLRNDHEQVTIYLDDSLDYVFYPLRMAPLAANRVNDAFMSSALVGRAAQRWRDRYVDDLGGRYPMRAYGEATPRGSKLYFDNVALMAELCRRSDARLMLVDQKLQSAYVLFCDLYARYLFETSFYAERKNGMVETARLRELMIAAQKRAFGGLLDESGYHPLFWCSKLHFYATDAPFYNFPYTFGFLFSQGVYAQAIERGAKVRIVGPGPEQSGLLPLEYFYVTPKTAEQGITCNAICPGYVYTPLVEAQIEGQAKAHGIPREQVIRDVLLAQQPNKRFATVEEIGALTVFLASEAAASRHSGLLERVQQCHSCLCS